jgi:hypothetical protein
MDCTCSSMIDEFEEHMHEAQVNLKKADVLHKRAQDTAQLVETPSFIWGDALYNSNNSCPTCLIMWMRRSHIPMKNPLTSCSVGHQAPKYVSEHWPGKYLTWVGVAQVSTWVHLRYYLTSLARDFAFWIVTIFITLNAKWSISSNVYVLHLIIIFVVNVLLYILSLCCPL